MHGSTWTETVTVAVIAAALGLAAGCASLGGTAEIPAVYTWTDCYPVENDAARDLGFLVDYCADPASNGRHWGLVAYRADSPREQYLALAWGIWYDAGRRPNASWMRVVLRIDNGETFIGALGVRPQIDCRYDDRGECRAIVVKLRGADGRVLERVFSARNP